jgi:hypothetical protein
VLWTSPNPGATYACAGSSSTSDAISTRRTCARRRRQPPEPRAHVAARWRAVGTARRSSSRCRDAGPAVQSCPSQARGPRRWARSAGRHRRPPLAHPHCGAPAQDRASRAAVVRARSNPSGRGTAGTAHFRSPCEHDRARVAGRNPTCPLSPGPLRTVGVVGSHKSCRLPRGSRHSSGWSRRLAMTRGRPSSTLSLGIILGSLGPPSRRAGPVGPALTCGFVGRAGGT